MSPLGYDTVFLVAVVAVAASTLAAVTGFGGAAVLLPVLIFAFGTRDAIPILTVAQLIGNGSRVWFNRRTLDYRVVGWFAVGAVPFSFLGGLLFAHVPLGALTRLLGVFLLLVVAWRRLGSDTKLRPTRPGFALIGGGAGFLSALLGSVGPIMAPFFLAYGLVKGAYIGTEALSTVVMHVTKLLAYRSSAVLPGSSIVVGLLLGPLMVFGSWTGKRIVDRLPERVFVLLIEATMTTAGLLFAIRGH